MTDEIKNFLGQMRLKLNEVSEYVSDRVRFLDNRLESSYEELQAIRDQVASDKEELAAISDLLWDYGNKIEDAAVNAQELEDECDDLLTNMDDFLHNYVGDTDTDGDLPVADLEEAETPAPAANS